MEEQHLWCGFRWNTWPDAAPHDITPWCHCTHTSQTTDDQQWLRNTCKERLVLTLCSYHLGQAHRTAFMWVMCLSTRTSPQISLFSNRTCSRTPAIPWVLVTPMQLYLEVFPYFELTGVNSQLYSLGEKTKQYEELVQSPGESDSPQSCILVGKEKFHNRKWCCLTTDNHTSK